MRVTKHAIRQPSSTQRLQDVLEGCFVVDQNIQRAEGCCKVCGVRSLRKIPFTNKTKVSEGDGCSTSIQQLNLRHEHRTQGVRGYSEHSASEANQGTHCKGSGKEATFFPTRI